MVQTIWSLFNGKRHLKFIMKKKTLYVQDDWEERMIKMLEERRMK
jgi:hypothetical protein